MLNPDYHQMDSRGRYHCWHAPGAQ